MKKIINTPGKAMLISDWKMILMAIHFREGTSMWFGKRGTSMIGFMVLQAKHENIDIKSNQDGDVICRFFDFYTNDTNQCAYNVNCAKLEVCRMCSNDDDEMIITKGFDERTDGAGCYAGAENRTLSMFYNDWLNGANGIDTLRIGSAGQNKTSLDTHFSYAWKKIKTSVRWNESNATNAEEFLTAAASYGGIEGTRVFTFTPDRSNQSFEKSHIHYGNAVLVENISWQTTDGIIKRGQRFRDHSSFGNYNVVSEDQIKKCFRDGIVKKPNCRLEEILKENNQIKNKMKITESPEFRKLKKQKKISKEEKIKKIKFDEENNKLISMEDKNYIHVGNDKKKQIHCVHVYFHTNVDSIITNVIFQYYHSAIES